MMVVILIGGLCFCLLFNLLPEKCVHLYQLQLRQVLQHLVLQKFFAPVKKGDEIVAGHYILQ